MSDTPAEIRLYLKVLSKTQTPEAITEILGVVFDECHRLGEPRTRLTLNEEWWQKNKRYWDENWWILRGVKTTTIAGACDDLESFLGEFLGRVEVKAGAFTQLPVGTQSLLSVVIQSNGYPGIGLSGQLLKKIASLNLSIDFDLYCDHECERLHADQE